MTPPEQSVGKKRRVPAGSFEPMDGPNYALPGVSQAPPPPLAPRIPPALLFGLLLAILLGAGGFLFFSSQADTEELTAETIGALIHQQEQTIRANAEAISESRIGSAILDIDSYPSGATVTIDGQVAGETPVYRDRLPSQWYVLSIRKDGHAPIDSLVYLESGQRARLSVTLIPSAPIETDGESEVEFATQVAGQPEQSARTPRPVQTPPQATNPAATPEPTPAQAGSIRVTSDPPGVAVTLDGQSVGTTPLNLNRVDAGAHIVELTLPDHETQTFQVNVEAGQQNTVQAAMTPIVAAPQTGSLSVIVHPWGSIYIDGTLHARDTDLRYEVTLPVGEHRIRVEHPALGVWERTVEVRPDQPTSLTADLSPR